MVVAGDCICTPSPGGKTPAHKHTFGLKLDPPLCLEGEVLLQAQEESGEHLHETPYFMSRELEGTIPPPQ